MDVSSVEQDVLDPVQCLGKLVASAILVECNQGIEGDDGIYSGSGVVGVDLARLVECQHLNCLGKEGFVPV